MVDIKLDMEKAYDRLDWNFIKHTLINIGFPMSFTKIIMNCLTTVSLSILINGYPIEYFQPSRGIRQGDPLSPYLFILYANVFSELITILEGYPYIEGSLTLLISFLQMTV